ncbi:MAG: inositol monophosphatase family protein [Fimbriimonadaceae bacterium]|nr:MAG: inositol monophosphatase family protein [Fimbriimonadaceae bacterium]
MGDWQKLNQATEQLLKQAAIIAQEQRKHLKIDQKKDRTLVTNVDRDIEVFLREQLDKLTPGAGVYGEEYGHSPATEAGYWVIDPIDGTSNFAYGQPLWGITAAYLYGGRIVSGVIHLPEVGETYTAVDGFGAYKNAEPIPIVAPGIIESTELVAHADSQVKYRKQTPGKMRHIGAFVVESSFVATQRYRALITGTIKLYDCAAGIIICRESGCEARYLTGEPFDESRHQGPDYCDPFYLGPKGSNFPFGSVF